MPFVLAFGYMKSLVKQKHRPVFAKRLVGLGHRTEFGETVASNDSLTCRPRGPAPVSAFPSLVERLVGSRSFNRHIGALFIAVVTPKLVLWFNATPP